MQLLRTLSERRITHLSAVPTLWRSLVATLRQLAATPAAAPQLHLRLAVSSGEPLPPALLAELREVLPAGCRILNLYGSTEVAADCTAFDATAWQPAGGGSKEEREAPVGSPIASTLIAVLAVPDGAAATAGASERAVLPLGGVGEVAVAGAGLAAGYLCATPETAAAQRRRFIELPTQQLAAAAQDGGSVAAASDLPAAFWQAPATRLFLTGDLGCLDAAGCLHLQGRRDHQLKIAGGRREWPDVE